MPLASQLFRNDRALEACSSVDSAHILFGAIGDHVGKIQFALFTLDAVPIDRGELLTQRYGRSTAAAVLRYKQQRNIVNHRYQNAADEIVGRLTIASLDKEMRLRELLPKPPGDCALSPPGTLNFRSVASAPREKSLQRGSSFADSRGAKTTANKQLGGVVQVFFAITRKAFLEDNYPLSASIERTRDSLFEHGIAFSAEFGAKFVDIINFSEPISVSASEVVDNVDQLRKASEDARPGLPKILRVIVCQMVGEKAGETFRNRIIGGRLVPPFVLLNSQIIDRSHATLIHEMIHASKSSAVPHDPEPFSIFFEFGSEKPGGTDRTFLKPEHALSLSKSFFALGSP